MSKTRRLALISLLLLAGCAGAERAMPPTPPANAALSAAPTVEDSRPPLQVSQPNSPERDTSKTDTPAATRPAKTTPAPARATPPGKQADTIATTGKPAAEGPLDLALLEKRLRDTGAIGVFTKIALKNQVDDLLKKFRAYYQGRERTTLAELRQPYDMLLLKVLSLLQDSDPGLARAIVASREAIWGMLADPNKFATL